MRMESNVPGLDLETRDCELANVSCPSESRASPVGQNYEHCVKPGIETALLKYQMPSTPVIVHDNGMRT